VLKTVPDPSPDLPDGVVTERRILALTQNWAVEHSISSSTEGLVSAGIEILIGQRELMLDFLRRINEWDMLFEDYLKNRPPGLGYVADGAYWKLRSRRCGLRSPSDLRITEAKVHNRSAAKLKRTHRDA